MAEDRSRISPFCKQCFVTATVSFNIIGHGAALGYPAVLLPQIGATSSVIPVSKDVASWIASAMAIPMLLGNFISPPIMDRLGRKMAHYAVVLPIIVGWLTIVLASGYEMLVIGRILHGLSFGMSLPLRSVLIGEYTSPKNRGAFLAMVSLAQSLGLFFVHLVGSLLSWQKTALICVFFSITSLIMMCYSPESPSYLVAKGEYDKCKKVFIWLRGEEEEEELEKMIEARRVFEKAAAERGRKKLGVRDTWKTMIKPEFYKPIILMVHAYAMTEFAGGNIMAAYSTVVIGLVLGPAANVNFWMITLDAQRIISNTAAVYVINRAKRRVIMFSIGTLSVVAYLALALYIYAKMNGILPFESTWLPVLLLNIHIFTLATGMVPLPSVIAGEVFPLEYRSVGGSISIISVASFCFLVLKTFPSLVDNIHLSGTYVLYAASITYFLVVIWFMLPETKGRTLQEIEDEYRGIKKPVDVEMSERMAEKEKMLDKFDNVELTKIES